MSEEQKYQQAIENKYVSGKFLNYALALVDEKSDSYTFFNNEKSMKISCFFVPKFYKGEEIVNPENLINLPYGEVVKEIFLEDKLDSIGLGGYIIVENSGGVLESIFERHNNYWLVMNFTEKVSDTATLKYEPYIFEVTSVHNISKFNAKEQQVKISFCDLFTGILSSHSIASLIKFEKGDKELHTSENYKIVFEKILNYLKRYLKINTDNYWELKKDAFYGEVTCFQGDKKINGYDKGLGLDKLVTASFNKMDRNMSILEAMQVLYKDCVTSIKMTDELKSIFEEVGDVLIPFFFKEEYADPTSVYPSMWMDQKEETSNEENKETPQKDESLFQKKIIVADDYGGESITMALRGITMRDFFMPFYLCFTNETPIIWEDINQGEEVIATMNGRIQDNLQSLRFQAIDKRSVDKRWKNAIFLDASAESSGCNCTLVFFDWFYRFFLKAFLNSSFSVSGNKGSYTTNGRSTNYISNVIPDFYFFQLLNGVGLAKNASDKTFNNLFDEYNANTYALTTTDSLNESLREMGKNIASFVLLNDSYTFALKGNLFRRPNEIMRLNVGDLFSGGDTQLNIFTNMKAGSSLFVYIRKVTHVFKGDEYVNGLTASKICESL